MIDNDSFMRNQCAMLIYLEVILRQKQAAATQLGNPLWRVLSAGGCAERRALQFRRPCQLA